MHRVSRLLWIHNVLLTRGTSSAKMLLTLRLSSSSLIAGTKTWKSSFKRSPSLLKLRRLIRSKTSRGHYESSRIRRKCNHLSQSSRMQVLAHRGRSVGQNSASWEVLTRITVTVIHGRDLVTYVLSVFHFSWNSASPSVQVHMVL